MAGGAELEALAHETASGAAEPGRGVTWTSSC